MTTTTTTTTRYVVGTCADCGQPASHFSTYYCAEHQYARFVAAQATPVVYDRKFEAVDYCDDDESEQR